MSSQTFADRAALAVGRQLANPSGSGGFLLAVMMRVFNRRPTRALIEALDIRPDHHVLDIGCGDGMALSAVPRTTWRYGVDQSETMLSIAWRRLNRDLKAGRVRLRHGDMLALPFGANAFDRILASNVLYFCTDIPALVQECRRVARPEAILGIYVTSARSMAKWPFAGPRTHRHFSREQLDAELETAGVKQGEREIRQLALPGGMEGLIALVRLVS